mmetsp:Transcript_23381/g.57945  ORF Transcript_23381/g.57945 Transcript_23381/m.57945 type:complete len:262 (-) Transcript_23381:161-946(-)
MLCEYKPRYNRSMASLSMPASDSAVRLRPLSDKPWGLPPGVACVWSSSMSSSHDSTMSVSPLGSNTCECTSGGRSSFFPPSVSDELAPALGMDGRRDRVARMASPPALSLPPPLLPPLRQASGMGRPPSTSPADPSLGSTCPIIPTPVPAARLGVIGLRGWMGTCEGCMRGASPRGPGMGEGDTRLSGGDRSRAPPRPWRYALSDASGAPRTVLSSTCMCSLLGVNGVRSMLMDCTIPPGLPLPSPTSTFPGALFRLEDYS